jgi:YbbR domain-containing protein
MEKKRLPIIVAATLFAILLWVSVNMSYDYQIVATVPLIIENLPAGKAIANPVPQAVQLKLRGTGWRSAAFSISGTPACLLDLDNLPSHKRGLVMSDIVDRMRMPLGVEAVDMKPESVFISFDRYAQKQVPIVLDAALAFRSGYGQIGQTVLTPESVVVGGAVSLLPTISVWPTVHTTFTDLKSSIDSDVFLADSASQYIWLSRPTVHVKVDVQQLAEKTITGLPVEMRSVPSNKEVILIPPKIDIIVRGGVQQLATVTSDSFRASIDYDDIVADSSGYADVAIVSPKGIQLVDRKPERMQFIIRTRL